MDHSDMGYVRSPDASPGQARTVLPSRAGLAFEGPYVGAHAGFLP